ncbi:MAG: Gfo/Idh/MocA family oxidoreductase [Actinobacteria bacterium]|nr:Gfo/Idh/MocA family oxidoreductase [Actinomycetota bacterium]
MAKKQYLGVLLMKSYVLVGVGGRSVMFTDALSGEFKDSAKLLALCDNNKGRMELRKKELAKVYPDLKCYAAQDFDKMVKENKPDSVIVCTRDSFHDEYICRALELGCDVITEKPMTIDEKKCQRIVDTVKKTGKKVRVTFNYRYSPPRTQIKKLLLSGVIGKVLSVEFQWLLDTSHGADYYRRWHRNKKNSGGLMVHKATHHFDLVNWWISSYPESVFAKGDRVFYNEKQARRYGLEKHGERCYDCQVSGKCNFFLDMEQYDAMKELYLDNEKYDGYERDLCVFSDQIDIEDTMNVVVRYNNGVYLSYSLNSFTPWEGYHVSFNGTKGRLEQHCHESSYISGDGKVQGGFQSESTSIRIYPHFRAPYEVEVEEGRGGHGGGDAVMLNDIFGKPVADPLKRDADYVQGAYSILTGIAANKSMATGKNIVVSELMSGLPEPKFVPMLGEDERIAFVKDAKRMSGGVVAEANIPMKISAPQ